MHEMGNIGDRLKRDFRAVKSTTTSSATRLKLFRTAFLTLFFRFGCVFGARRLVKDVLNCSRNTAHPNLLATTPSRDVALYVSVGQSTAAGRRAGDLLRMQVQVQHQSYSL
jgi:hypothetical protein